MRQSTEAFMQNLIDNEPARPNSVPADPTAGLEEKINQMVDARIKEKLKEEPDQVVVDATVVPEESLEEETVNSEENTNKEE